MVTCWGLRLARKKAMANHQQWGKKLESSNLEMENLQVKSKYMHIKA